MRQVSDAIGTCLVPGATQPRSRSQTVTQIHAAVSTPCLTHAMWCCPGGAIGAQRHIHTSAVRLVARGSLAVRRGQLCGGGPHSGQPNRTAGAQLAAASPGAGIHGLAAPLVQRGHGLLHPRQVIHAVHQSSMIMNKLQCHLLTMTPFVPSKSVTVSRVSFCSVQHCTAKT